MAKSGQKVQINLTANNQATPVIAQVRAKLNGLLGGVGSKSVGLTKQMGGAAVTAGLAAAGLAMSWKEVYAKVMEASYEAKRFVVMGKRFSMPAAEIAKLSRYAETAGLNVGTIGRGMLMLQKFAQDGIGGATGQTKELIDKLGLTQGDLEEVRKGGMGAFIKIREAMGDMMSEGEQMAVWQQLIGQRAFEMAEFLKKSPEEMAEATTKAIGMSERVIQGLAAGQKEYANFQAEISKLFGELAHDLGWLFGLIGLILRAMMSAIRLLRLVAVGLKVIVMYAISFAQILAGKINDGWETAEKATKEWGETWKEVNEDLKRDNSAMFGGDSNTNATRAQATVRQTLRTYEEIAKYQEALNKMKEDEFKTNMDSAWNDEVKLDIMDAELRKIDEQIRLLRVKYKDEAEFTAEFLTLDARRLEIERERKKLSKEIYFKGQDQALRKYTQDVEHNVAMGKEGYKDEDYWNIQKAYEEAKSIGHRYRSVLEDKTASVQDRTNAQLDFEKAMNNVTEQVNNYKKKSPNAVVDNLQSIGGGGRIGGRSTGVAEASLAQLERQTSYLADISASLKALNGKTAGAVYEAGATFLAQTGVRRQEVSQQQANAQLAQRRAAEAARQAAAAEAAWNDPATRARIEAAAMERRRQVDASPENVRQRRARDNEASLQAENASYGFGL